MARPVIHWEIGARDGAKLREFYTALFGWTITGDSEYALVTAEEGGIGGGILQTHDDMPPYVAIYVGVDELQGTLDRAAELGGHTVVPPMPIPNVGTFAMFSDPDGNLIGIMAEPV